MPPTRRYRRRALAWLVTSTVIYLTINGAGLFETVTVVPRWAADPPASLELLRGPYGLDFQAFWITAHSLHELTFLAAVVCCWRIPGIRHRLLALLAVHVALRAWTLVYFAPQILEFQSGTLTPGPALVAQTALWQDLNYVRVALFAAVSLALLPLIRALARTEVVDPAEPAGRREPVAVG